MFAGGTPLYMYMLYIFLYILAHTLAFTYLYSDYLGLLGVALAGQRLFIGSIGHMDVIQDGHPPSSLEDSRCNQV